jgi:YspA, cpYpsA-related SLOG family
MVKLAVVGSTTWTDIPFMRRALDRFHAKHGVTLLVSGGAKGADSIGERWASDRKIERLIHPAKWQEGPQKRHAKGHLYDPQAGHIRNELIVRDADVVIAFVSDWRTSRGTRNTVAVHVKAQAKPCFMYDAATGAWTQNDAASAWLARTEVEPTLDLMPPLGRVPCARCGGTGQFITRVENGEPKGPGGPCFRCAGKGYQDDADRRRNYGYDNFAPIRGE